MRFLAILGALARAFGGVAWGQVFTEFSIPTAASGALGITVGPDGNLWFTEFSGNKVGRITTGGAITEFPVPTPSAGAFGITSGPGGYLWFMERTAGKIGRITTAGVIIGGYLSRPVPEAQKLYRADPCIAWLMFRSPRQLCDPDSLRTALKRFHVTDIFLDSGDERGGDLALLVAVWSLPEDWRRR